MEDLSARLEQLLLRPADAFPAWGACCRGWDWARDKGSRPPPRIVPLRLAPPLTSPPYWVCWAAPAAAEMRAVALRQPVSSLIPPCWEGSHRSSPPFLPPTAILSF